MMMRSMPPASAHLARDAGAGPAADDRLAGGDLGPEAGEDSARGNMRAGVRGSGDGSQEANIGSVTRRPVSGRVCFCLSACF